MYWSMGIYKTNEDGNDEYVAGISDGEEDKGYSFFHLT